MVSLKTGGLLESLERSLFGGNTGGTVVIFNHPAEIFMVSAVFLWKRGKSHEKNFYFGFHIERAYY